VKKGLRQTVFLLSRRTKHVWRYSVTTPGGTRNPSGALSLACLIDQTVSL